MSKTHCVGGFRVSGGLFPVIRNLWRNICCGVAFLSNPVMLVDMQNKTEALLDPKTSRLAAEERKALKGVLTARNESGRYSVGNTQMSRFLKDWFPATDAPSETSIRRWRSTQG